jgi:signal transduction histidine kinase
VRTSADFSQPPSIFVSFVVQGELFGHLVGESETHSTCRSAEKWSVSAATDAVLELVESVDVVASMTVIPFERGHESVGGVLAFADPVLEASAELAEISASLVAQLEDVLSLQQPEDRVVANERELRERKLEALAEFAAGAGHEVNNPLGTITGRVALLLKSEDDPERRRMLETIGGQAHRIKDMIGDAMTFARPPEPLKEVCDVCLIVREVVAQMTRLFPDVRIETDIAATTVSLSIDPEQFRVVIAALVRNSVEAIQGLPQDSAECESGASNSVGQIMVRVESIPSRSLVKLSVEDNGRGMSDLEREHLFDPFFSGRQAGRGLGFGLSKCWQILRMHGGIIEIDDDHSPGIKITTQWPA